MLHCLNKVVAYHALVNGCALSTFEADGDGQLQIFGEEQLRASYHRTGVVVLTVY